MKKGLWIVIVAMVFAILATPLSASQKFTDVQEKDWYQPYVYDLVEQGIIDGMTPTTFEPKGTIKRGEFAKILAYASGDDLTKYKGACPFSDCTKHWSKTNINWAYENKIVNGTSPTTLHWSLRNRPMQKTPWRFPLGVWIFLWDLRECLLLGS